MYIAHTVVGVLRTLRPALKREVKVSPSLLVRGQPRAAEDKKEGRRLSVGMTCSDPTPQDGAARTLIVLVPDAPGK